MIILNAYMMYIYKHDSIDLTSFSDSPGLILVHYKSNVLMGVIFLMLVSYFHKSLTRSKLKVKVKKKNANDHLLDQPLSLDH